MNSTIIFRVKNTQTELYYSRGWANPTFTPIGQLFKTEKSALNAIKRLKDNNWHHPELLPFLKVTEGILTEK